MTSRCSNNTSGKAAFNTNCNRLVLHLALFSFLCLSQVLAQQELVADAADNKTCVLSQQCKDIPGHCGSASAGVFNPALDIRAPTPIVDPIEHVKLAKNCPMYANQGQPVCCVPDQANIMDVNFNSIDSVFGRESGACGVNLKILWCHFTCDPHQNDFVKFSGVEQVDQHDGTFKNFTKVTFAVDEDYACTVFRSCKKVSIVAMADLQSSIAFLDFLGVSGQNTSMSIITFTFDPLKNGTNVTTSSSFDPMSALSMAMSPKLQKKCGAIEEELAVVTTDVQDNLEIASEKDTITTQTRQSATHSSSAKNQTGMPLRSNAYPCYQKINNQTLAGYTKVPDSTCTFCSEVCEPPSVDDYIGFFDGFDQTMVYIVYGCLIAFSLLFQVYVCTCRDKKANEELKELKNEVLYKSYEQVQHKNIHTNSHQTQSNDMEEE